MNRIDTYKHKGLRQQMVDKLRAGGITDEAVLQAMNDVPRHFFIDSALDSLAYEDQALKIGCGQTISHPSTVAMQSQLLAVRPAMKVLEIGTGSGYQTAILCRLGAKVFTIERQKGLFDLTSKLLRELGYRVQCFLGDGYQGLSGAYDRIIVTCGAPEIPEALMRQLKVGGIMVIPLDTPPSLRATSTDPGEESQQEMLRITKQGDSRDQWLIEKFGTYSFVPMLNGKEMSK